MARNNGVMLGVVDLLRAVRGTVSLRFRRWRTPGGLAALVVVGGIVALWVVIWIPGDGDVDPPAGAAPSEGTRDDERAGDERAAPDDDGPASRDTDEAAPGTTSTGPADPGAGTSTTEDGDGSEPGDGSDSGDAPTHVEPGPAGNTPTPTSPPSSSPPPTTPGTTTTTTAPPAGSDGGWLDDLLDVLDLG